MAGNATLRVLLVDDEADLAEGYQRLLQAVGYSCDTANNGRQAIELAEERKPSLVITDLTMPVMDGFELIRWLRRRWPKLPVIAMTAFHTPHAERSALSAGATIYLRKPFSNSELRELVKKTLAGAENGTPKA